MWHDLLASRELAWRLLLRDIRARYRQSVLGVIWAFIPPLATAAVFIVLNREGVIRLRATQIPYPAFVLIGTVLWQLFIDSLNAPLRVVTNNKLVLAKVNFPREGLILSAMGQVLFDFGIKLLIVAGVFAFYRIPLTPGLLLAPVAVLALMMLGFMIGLLITPLGVLYTDVAAALPTLVSLWFFATPVVYPTPERWPYSLLISFNPVSPLLVGTRDLMTLGMLPNVWPFAITALLTVVGLFAMWTFCRISLPILVERIGA